MFNMLKRTCPKCGYEIFYSNRSNWNRGNRTNALCFGCSNKTRIGQKRTEEQRIRISEATQKAMSIPTVRKNFLSTFTDERRKLKSNSTKKQMDNILKTEKGRMEWSKKLSVGTKEKWLSRTYEEKQQILSLTLKARESFLNKLKDKNYKINHVRKIHGTGKTKDTKPELEVKTILESNGIEFKHPYQLDTKVFDFFIPEKNLLIEVDGIYWHGKNLTFDKMDSIQKKHKLNDEIKNKLAESLGFKLLRIWEDDIDRITLTERIYNI